MPPLSVSVPAVMVARVLTTSVPPVKARLLLGLAALPKASVLMVEVPVLCVMVWAPATLMTTSSAASGNSGSLLQLVAVCHEPVVPIQLTTAAPPGPLPIRAKADKTAKANGFLARQNRTRDFMTFPYRYGSERINQR